MILEAKLIKNSNYDFDDLFPVLKKFHRSLNKVVLLKDEE